MMGKIGDILARLVPTLAAVDVEEIPAALGEIERLKALLYARLTVPAPAPPAPDADQLLTAEDVHQRTQLSTKWLYRHADALPFTRRVGRKVLFSSAGLSKWLATRRPDTHGRDGGSHAR